MADYSCYVSILNNTQNSMNLQGTPVDTHGNYSTNPAQSIAQGSSTNFLMTETIYGPVGSCVYSVTDESGSTSTITFSYSCPKTSQSLANAHWNGNSLSDITIQMIPNPLPGFGYPMYVQFTIIQN